VYLILGNDWVRVRKREEEGEDEDEGEEEEEGYLGSAESGISSGTDMKT